MAYGIPHRPDKPLLVRMNRDENGDRSLGYRPYPEVS